MRPAKTMWPGAGKWLNDGPKEVGIMNSYFTTETLSSQRNDLLFYFSLTPKE